MPISAARAAAFEILLRIERDRSYSSELLHSSRFSNLPATDHGLLTELVMGSLRWRPLIDQWLAAASSKKLSRLDLEVLTALRLGAYQLQFLSRVPDRAAIFESVELVKAARKRSAAPFVNAVLRKVSSAALTPPLATLEDAQSSAVLAQVSAHPEWLVSRWAEAYGLPTARRICLADQTVPRAAVRLPDNQTEERLEREGLKFSPGLLVSGARRVSPADAVHARARTGGRVFIQDEASQLVALLAGRGQKILDCCAAPGGKTAILAERNSDSRIIACDLHPHRASLLRRLTRASNIQVAAADACALPFATEFDRILADVPCSGTGTLAHNPEIKWRRTPEDLVDFGARQMAILGAALGRLSPGGRLVYSTCSLEFEENEAVVEAVVNGMPDFHLIDCREPLHELKKSGELAWQEVDSLLRGRYLRTVPGIHPCDGFFAAVVERRK